MPGFMTWKNAYSVNIAELDQQHQNLVALIDKLGEAMSRGQGKEVIEAVLTQLLDHCAHHFAAEEQLFDQYHYPEAAAHKEEHQMVTAKILALQQEMREGKKTIAMTVLDLLVDWLDHHILGTDMQYSKYLTDKGVK